MTEENKQDSPIEDSINTRLSNIENALERIEKCQDDQKELLKTQADLELQLGSWKVQEATARSQMEHEDMAIRKFKFDLLQA